MAECRTDCRSEGRSRGMRLTARVQMTDDSAGSGVGEERVDLESILNGGLTGYVKG